MTTPPTTPDSSPATAVPAASPWHTQDEAVPGPAHRNKNLPCQDAARAVSQPRPVLVLADGAGSSAVSEIGARAVVHGLVRLIDTLDKPLSAWLDQDSPDPAQQARNWGLLLVKHARGLLTDLAAEHRRERRDFRCTLLVAVVGRQHLLWLKVGDGEIVVETRQPSSDAADPSAWHYQLGTLGTPDKGEFANQTSFIDEIALHDVQIGCLPSAAISGLALMSDGAAEKLVSRDGRRVATRLSKLLQQLRDDKLKRSELTRMFYQDDFCTGTNLDDRSLALAARQLPEPAIPAPTPTPTPDPAPTPTLATATAAAPATDRPTAPPPQHRHQPAGQPQIRYKKRRRRC